MGLAKGIHNGGQVIGAETFTGLNANASFFSLLELADTFFGMFFQLEYFFGNIEKDLSRVGQYHFFPETIHQPDIVMLLQFVECPW